MGIYINVPDSIGKLNWLLANAQPLAQANPVPVFKEQKAAGNVILAYIRNPGFDAIAVLFSITEARRFSEGRPDAGYFIMPKALVLEACPEAQGAI